MAAGFTVNKNRILIRVHGHPRRDSGLKCLNRSPKIGALILGVKTFRSLALGEQQGNWIYEKKRWLWLRSSCMEFSICLLGRYIACARKAWTRRKNWWRIGETLKAGSIATHASGAPSQPWSGQSSSTFSLECDSNWPNQVWVKAIHVYHSRLSRFSDICRRICYALSALARHLAWPGQAWEETTPWLSSLTGNADKLPPARL